MTGQPHAPADDARTHGEQCKQRFRAARRRVATTMVYATSATFQAPPDIVFDTLLDPIGMSRWLPHDVSANPAGSGTLEVILGPDEGSAGSPGQKRVVALTYLHAPEAGFVVQATITALPVGGSSVDITADPATCTGDPIATLVDQAVTALREEIADRFTPG